MPQELLSPYRVQKPPAGCGIDYISQVSNGIFLSLDMQEGSGTTIFDNAGEFGNQKLGVGVTWRPSSDTRLGMVLDFDGTVNGRVPLNGALVKWVFGTSSFSVEAWFRNSMTGVFANILRADTGLIGSGLLLIRQESSNKLSFGYYDATRAQIANVISPLAYNDGKWHHAVGIRDLTSLTCRLIIDGQQVITGVDTGGSISFNDTPYLGLLNHTTGEERYTGQIGLFRVWNRTLTISEAQSLYNEPFSILRSPDTWRRLIGSSSIISTSTYRSLLPLLGVG